MKTDIKKIEKGQVEITIELTPEEYQPYLEMAAKKISENTKIDGFRPGKANYDLIEKKVGKNEVWQQALEPAIQKSFVKVLSEEKLYTVGQPHIDIVKLAPDNNVVFKATVALLPEVELGDLDKLAVEKKEVKLDEERFKKAMEDLTKMNSKEAAVSREAKKGDKLVISFETFLDKVPMENGKYKEFPVVLGENTFIPGFEDQLVGMKKGDEKKFQLEFPKDYHQKNLAGKLADFTVKVDEVYEVTPAELNDDLAKTLGFETIKAIEEEIKTNLKMEAQKKEDQRIEEEIIGKVIEASKFDDIPETLITSEVKKMMEELEHNISHQGLTFEDYLNHIKKSREELMLDFSPQAIKRVKSALAMRKIGEQNKIDVSDAEVEDEVQKTLLAYGNNPDAEKQINTLSYKNYLRNIIASKKIIEHLKSKMVK